MTTLPEPVNPNRSRWIPYAFIGAFLVVILANATLIVAAQSTWIGLVVEKPFERGVHYNDLLAAVDRQNALGWTATAAPEAYQPIGGVLTLGLHLAGREGEPLDGTVRVRLVRPVPGRTVELPAVPLVNGQARMQAADITPGQWQVEMIFDADGHRFVAEQRLVLR